MNIGRQSIARDREGRRRGVVVRAIQDHVFDTADRALEGSAAATHGASAVDLTVAGGERHGGRLDVLFGQRVARWTIFATDPGDVVEDTSRHEVKALIVAAQHVDDQIGERCHVDRVSEAKSIRHSHNAIERDGDDVVRGGSLNHRSLTSDRDILGVKIPKRQERRAKQVKRLDKSRSWLEAGRDHCMWRGHQQCVRSTASINVRRFDVGEVVRDRVGAAGGRCAHQNAGVWSRAGVREGVGSRRPIDHDAIAGRRFTT